MATDGRVLTVVDIDEVGVEIAEKWQSWSQAARDALEYNEEVRQYLYATDTGGTEVSSQGHHNKTRMPKLTEISDTLVSYYYDAMFSRSDWFVFEGDNEEDARRGKLISDWLRSKLERKRFRQTVARRIISDYVNYGNCFCEIDFVVEKDAADAVMYRGAKIRKPRVAQVSFNPSAEDFSTTPKIRREELHVSQVASLNEDFPDAGFDEAAIEKVKALRTSGATSDWTEYLHNRGIIIDGFNSTSFMSETDMVEILIYRGDVFHRDTGLVEKNRVVYVADRNIIIRNTPNVTRLPGIYHAAWRQRNDSLWGQSALDLILGMQYRCDHLENLKADVFDVIGRPALKIKGTNVVEPEDGFGPRATYYMDENEDVQFLVPDTTVLSVDNQVETYHRRMEEYAGVPPQKRGIRTPGEKTAFEITTLEDNANLMFMEKVEHLEAMFEDVLTEMYHMELENFDGEEAVKTFNDVTKAEEIQKLTEEDIKARGRFRAVGSKHWRQRGRRIRELNNLVQILGAYPELRNHMKGLKWAEKFAEEFDHEDTGLVEEFAGIKELVEGEAVAEQQRNQIAQQSGQPAQGIPTNGTDGTLQGGPPATQGGAIPI